MSIVSKVKNASMLLFVMGAASMPTMALAASDRLAGKQVSYLSQLAELGILLLNAGLFLVSLFVLGAGCWFFIKDYILAKSDHEKSFSPMKVVAAMVVASLMGYSSGAYLIGQDLTTGSGVTTISQEQFKRPG
jgi:hypothetical protein